MNIPAKKDALPLSTTIEDVLIGGDLSKLTAEQRTEYYLRVCTSLHLNPMTRPFDYLTLNGKLQLYARKDAADQLRKINGISTEIVSQYQNAEGLYTVHARAKDKDGRTDEDYGVVSMGNLKADFAANMILKCVTKAKRRVTLSICGLGFLDETEVEDIPPAAKKATAMPAEPVSPYQLPLTRPPNWIDFGADLLHHIRDSRSRQEANQWLSLNSQSLKALGEDDEKVFKRLDAAIQKAFREELGEHPGVESAAEMEEMK